MLGRVSAGAGTERMLIYIYIYTHLWMIHVEV